MLGIYFTFDKLL